MHVASRDRTYKEWMLWDDGGQCFQTSDICSHPLSAADLAFLRTEATALHAHTLLPDGISESELSLLGAKASPSPLPYVTDFPHSPGSFPSAQTALISPTLKKEKHSCPHLSLLLPLTFLNTLSPFTVAPNRLLPAPAT